MTEVLKNVLSKIRPSPDEQERVKKFVKNLLTTAKTISGLDSAICGSIGKFTWLKGDHDIDLFMLFPKSVPRDELERRGLEYGKKIAADMRGTYVVKYAEHPYVHAAIDGFGVDIVPCYRIRKGEKIISAVDRSPLHLEHILDNLDEEKRDDVRLLKQFCKGIGAYGSDARHQGFSGYICELLVLKYGSFLKAVKDVARWAAPKIIGNADPKQYNSQPLIIIDPVDAKRNVAANLNSENFVRFVAACREFAKKPDEIYFFPEKRKPLGEDEIKELASRGTELLAVAMDKPDIIEDVLYPQMRKALDRLLTLMKHNEFVVLKSSEYANGNIAFVFEMEVWSLPAVKKMTGPSIFSKKHSREFRSKYRNNFISVEDVFWVAEKEREFRSASALLKGVLSKSDEELKSMGIPDNIAKLMPRARLLEGRDFWDFVAEKEKFSAFLREKYFGSLN